jgi:hypothetical protein
MRSIVWSALIALAALVPARGQICNLVTTELNNTSGNQHVFDVMNLTAGPVRVTQIDSGLTSGVGDVFIYMVTGGGTQVGKTNQPGLWTLVAHFPGVNGLGTSATAPPLITPLPPLPCPVDLPPGPTGIYIFRSSGSTAYNATSPGVVGTPIVSDGVLEIQTGYAIGTNFPAALPTLTRKWAGRIHYHCTYPGPLVTGWQVNQPEARLTVDGVVGSGCTGVVVTREVYACTPLVPAVGMIDITSSLIGMPWDVALSAAPAVPASMGGLTLSDGQHININLGQPVGFLNGFFALTWPGAGIPGVTSSTLSMAYSIQVQTDLSMQAAWIDPSAGSGLRLSQATEFHVNLLPPTATFTPALADNATMTLNFAAAPYCWATGIPFYGTSYTQMHILSNGRVMFGAAGTTTAAPTVALFISNNPSVGVWTDWNPALPGGSVVATNVGGGIIRVDYATRYAGETAGPICTFGIEFDVNTGDVRLDGLTGIAANPQGTAGGAFSATADDMLMGISRGGSVATNSGPTVFGAGSGGLASSATHMWYDFYDAVLATDPGRCASLQPGTLQSVTFIPSGGFAPNYDWLGL